MSAATRRIVGVLLLILTMGFVSCSAFVTSCTGYMNLVPVTVVSAQESHRQ